MDLNKSTGIPAIHDVTRDGSYVTVWLNGRGLKISYPTERAAQYAHVWLVDVLRRFAQEAESRRSTKPKIYIYGREDVTIAEFIEQYQNIVEHAGYYTEWSRNEEYEEIFPDYDGVYAEEDIY